MTNIRKLFKKYGCESINDLKLCQDIEELIKEKVDTQESWLGRKSIEEGGKWYSNTSDRIKELGNRILHEPIKK